MQREKLYLGRRAAAFTAFAAVTAGSPALAVNPDTTVDQLAVQSSVGGRLIEQIGSTGGVSTYLDQVEAPAITNDFQAYAATIAYSQLAGTEQVQGLTPSDSEAIELAFLGYGLDLGRSVRNGRGALYSSDAASNSQRYEWNGTDNLQASAQRGNANLSEQSQDGSFNTSLAFQHGDSNLIKTVQNTDGSFVSVVQLGSHNTAFALQTTRNSFISVSQTGTGNIVSVRQ